MFLLKFPPLNHDIDSILLPLTCMLDVQGILGAAELLCSALCFSRHAALDAATQPWVVAVQRVLSRIWFNFNLHWLPERETSRGVCACVDVCVRLE